MNGTETMDWSLLSPADKSVLASLGIVEPEVKEKKKYIPKCHNPITVERRMSTRNTAPPEYYVQIEDTCGCCKTTGIREGKMAHKKPSDNFLSLVLQDLPEDVEYRKLRITSINCVNCDQVLESLGTLELVKIIKTLHNIAATKCLP